MRLLYISQRLPFPPDRGDRIPVYHHVRILSKKHSVTVASLLENPSEQIHVEALQKILAEAKKGGQVLVATQSKWQRWVGMLMAFLRGKPLSLGYFYNASLKKRIQHELKLHPYDAIIVFSSSMAHYVEEYPAIPRIMNFCDVDSRKWADLSSESTLFKRFIFRREARLLAQYEINLSSQFSGCCFVTQAECDLFKSMAPKSDPRVIPNGVEINRFSEIPRKPIRHCIAFVGVMDYEPNVEAVLFFAESVLPAIRSQFSDCEFTIVGARPSPKILALSQQPGISVTGYVDDVRPHMAQADVIVVPLKVARGIQNKVLEAIAAWIPVITSTAVAASLPTNLRDQLTVVDRDTQAWIEAITTAFLNPENPQLKAMRALAILREGFTWEAAVESLENMVAEAIQQSKPIPG